MRHGALLGLLAAALFGVAGAALWLGEGLGAAQIAAAGLLVVANALWLVEEHGHRHRHRATTHEHRHRHDDGHHDHEHDGIVAGWHCHEHRHGAVEHAHPHLPDLHHRHEHGRAMSYRRVDINRRGG